MSAYIVDRAHIRFLVEAASRVGAHTRSFFSWYYKGERGELRPGDCDRASGLGALLWRENLASVSYRYRGEQEESLPGPGNDGPRNGYTHALSINTIKPIDVLKALDCYEYQSCEHPEWNDSEAKAVCTALRHAAISNLPGYDAAPWGAPEGWAEEVEA